MEKLLFFGLTDAEFQKIKPVASRLKLHCEQIPVSMYHNTLGVIASGRAVPAGIPAAPGTPVPASLTAALGADAPAGASARSDERRVGKECVSTWMWGGWRGE